MDDDRSMLDVTVPVFTPLKFIVNVPIDHSDDRVDKGAGVGPLIVASLGELRLIDSIARGLDDPRGAFMSASFGEVDKVVHDDVVQNATNEGDGH